METTKPKSSFMNEFVNDNFVTGNLNESIADEISNLCLKYRLPELAKDTTVITAEFGILGSIIIKKIESFEPKELKYISGSHDYISVRTNSTRKILWTDFSDTEPYNRMGGLYCSGASWAFLGEPIRVTEQYREFDKSLELMCNESFAVSGFHYNSFWKSVDFGICLPNDKVEEFITKLKLIINK